LFVSRRNRSVALAPYTFGDTLRRLIEQQRDEYHRYRDDDHGTNKSLF
jgi:hypothetical protein